MRRAVFITAACALLTVAAIRTATAQERYTYSVTRTRSIPINWLPETKTYQRYTVSVSPFMLLNNGLKVNFEYELPKPGHWFGTSLTAYIAPPRHDRGMFDLNGYGNDRATFNSNWDDFHRMWGFGTSAFFKNTFSRRGWYFSTGIVFDFFRVGVMSNSYIPYSENGLTFYDFGRTLETKSYFKPTVQLNFGKHIAVSTRLYFDLYAGLGLSHSFFRNDRRHHHDGYGWPYRYFSEVGGFGYRGLAPTGGFRFGMLLWE